MGIHSEVIRAILFEDSPCLEDPPGGSITMSVMAENMAAR